ncbi:MAG TPA: FeoA family protein [Geobacteraceae bacterium]
MMPLGLLGPGQRGEIIALKFNKAHCGDGCRPECRTEDMGLRVGKTVEMLNNGGGGPILLRIDESRIAVDRSLAMKIMVKEVGQ